MTSDAKFLHAPAIASNPAVIYPYVIRHMKESSAREELRLFTAKKDRAVMMGAPDVASLLAWLVRLIHAKRVIEVGVFRGYTTLALAEALPPDGCVVGLDVSHDFVDTARPFWAKSPSSAVIDIRIAPALESMTEMLQQRGEAGTYDLVFIDADKENYPAYYELAVQLLRPGGIIAVDNTLWDGLVATQTPQEMDAPTKAIYDLNNTIAGDTRVDQLLLPLSDGLYLARKL